MNNNDQTTRSIQTIDITLPVKYHFEVHDGKEFHMIYTTEKTKNSLNLPILTQGETKEEAIRKFWIIANIHLDYLNERKHQADKWEPLRIGPWKSKGGRWFTIFGQHFSFRYGKQNKGGWFVPFTKLNISYYNEWKRKPKKNEK